MHYLVSTSGHPNYGDELIARGWLEHLAAVAPQEEVWVDAPHPGVASTILADAHPRLRVTDTLWRLRFEDGHVPLDEVDDVAATKVRDFGTPAFDLGIEVLRRASTVHLLGGGYVNDYWPRATAMIAGMRAVKELTGARLFATGLGLMPAVQHLDPRAVFAGFDHVSVRDEPSAAAFGVPQGVDDAFLAVPGEIARAAAAAGRAGSADGRREIVVCLQGDMGGATHLNRAVRLVRQTIERNRDQVAAVRYVEGVPGTDYAGYERLHDVVDEFVPFSRVWREGLPVHADQLWLSTRFHHHLVAAAAGARGMALSVSAGYYDLKHASLTALGSGWPVVPLHDGAAAVQARAGQGFADHGAAAIEAKRAEAASLYGAP